MAKKHRTHLTPSALLDRHISNLEQKLARGLPLTAAQQCLLQKLAADAQQPCDGNTVPSYRQLARALGITHPTILEYARRPDAPQPEKGQHSVAAWRTYLLNHGGAGIAMKIEEHKPDGEVPGRLARLEFHDGVLCTVHRIGARIESLVSEASVSAGIKLKPEALDKIALAVFMGLAAVGDGLLKDFCHSQSVFNPPDREPGEQEEPHWAPDAIVALMKRCGKV